ncbi:UvrABC system C [Gossypium arboreum]|uniref:UvrABC system C n=1 Tax=Gossypium arboreum TaxID=29729 RepID=A0A0B0N323_GOSAR|nr:UvrABC system C [Gossypium arboreum]
MFRSRTKEIRFGSGENKSCRLVIPFHFTSSKILDQVTSSGIIRKVHHTIYCFESVMPRNPIPATDTGYGVT